MPVESVVAINPVTGALTHDGGGGSVTQSTSPWIVAGGGTAGTPGSAVLAVQGVASGTAVPVSSATLATEATLDARTGALTETAPATDTASSGLNGRLQRIAQRLTSLIALIPASLGQKAMAASLAVTVASDQTAIPASQSGTWTVGESNSFNNITSNTTTVVKSGAGVLAKLTINTTAAGAITIYDNTAASGTKIATLPASAVVGTYDYDVAFATGLTIVTAASSDITVSYR